jgi:hypothetical protein
VGDGPDCAGSGPVMDWMTTMHWCVPLLASTFVIAGALWIGTLFSVSWLSGCARMMADGPEIGRLALSLFRRWTTPSLCVTLLTGLGWLAATLGGARAHWHYWIAFIAAPLVALHAAAGRRAKGVAEGDVDATQEAVMPMRLSRG